MKTEKKLRGNEKRYGIGVFRDWIVWPISALVSVSLSATVELRPGKREFERHSGTGRG